MVGPPYRKGDVVVNVPGPTGTVDTVVPPRKPFAAVSAIAVRLVVYPIEGVVIPPPP